ncbi:Serine/threonine protein kinase [hydrothermal vent metagenome]|uniref:Serine/threonine protein kinase n=1 Tax=hydrothermal vent metagenome TaxID=652676 RepID=A0A3B0Y3N2_9ZZZZ
MTIECENALSVGSKLNGTQEDQYEILSVLGAGGFGITYKARDHLLQSDVAIKEYLPLDLALRNKNGTTVIPRTSTQQQDYEWGLERFLDEARTLSRFKTQANIVRVESFLPANGTAYMVMQYEEGESLEEYLSRLGVLDEEQLKGIMFPILDGLRAIHAEGFLHRDIKPANIYLRKNGTPILLDFGAARQALGNHSQSITGILTAGYAPFEQYSTRSNLSAATDLYSLGATLYKCISNITPVEATERINALHNDEADPLIALEYLVSKTYSSNIYQGLNWMLEPLAKDRPQSVEAVIEKFIVADNVSDSASSSQRASGVASVNKSDNSHDSNNATSRSANSDSANSHNATSRSDNADVHKAKTILQTGSTSRDSDEFDHFSLAKKSKAVKSKTVKSKTVKSSFNNKSLVPVIVFTSMLAVLAVAAVLVFGGFFASAEQTDYDKAKAYYYQYQYEKAWPLFKTLATKEDALSEYFLSEITRINAKLALTSKNSSDNWLKRAIAHGLIQQLESRASNKNPHYQAILGYMHFRGGGVSKNYVQAALWFRKAANNGSLRATNALGVMYANGLGFKQDNSKAVVWFKKAAMKGDAEGQVNLGRMYNLGLGLTKDYQQAKSWFEKSAMQGNSEAQAKFGFTFQMGRGQSKNYTQAVKWYRKSVKQGNGLGQARLATMYRLGLGVTKNYAIALQWNKKSAAQNNLVGQYNLGYSYFYGIGVIKDHSQSFRWYQKSALQGYSTSQVNLGFMYGRGYGVTKNYTKAVYWYRKASALGHPMGSYNMGVMSYAGRGLPKNIVKAFQWYKKAALQGVTAAQNRLGIMYEFGQGIKKNYRYAVHWYRQSANQKNAKGQYYLGTMYQSGRGVIKDYRIALRWYRLAQAQRLNLAQRALGVMYEKGKGVVTNIDTARMWFSKAEANGLKRASIDLKRINNLKQITPPIPVKGTRPGGSGLFNDY